MPTLSYSKIIIQQLLQRKTYLFRIHLYIIFMAIINVWVCSGTSISLSKTHSIPKVDFTIILLFVNDSPCFRTYELL